MRGFTLLEVLVALVFLAISMFALVATSGHVTNTDSQLRDKTFATWVAMNELTTLRLGGAWPSGDSLDGDADMAGRKWHWKAAFQKTEDPDLLRVDISVSSEDNKDQEIAALTGFMGNPVTGGTPPPGPP
ncbi:MAG: type II secretion system minor pseudopilin GspI [Bacillota bacterium]